MDGIHDMGGQQGYGQVPYIPDEKVRVATRWEAFAGAGLFALLRSGKTNIDAHRHRIERIDPTAYLPITYWGRWLAAIEAATVDQEIATQTEIDEAVRSVGSDPKATAPPAFHPPVSLESQENDPTFIRTVRRQRKFGVGDSVVTSRDAPQNGHHRLPRYARGRTGTIVRCYPAFVFPDTVAHGNGEQPQYVYAVAFTGTELWGDDAEENQLCHLDLFEPYLDGPT